MVSRAPPLGWHHPAGTVKGWPRACCCNESSLDIDRETLTLVEASGTERKD